MDEVDPVAGEIDRHFPLPAGPAACAAMKAGLQMTNPLDLLLSRKSRLLREFDLCVKYSRPVLARYYGEENVQALAAETRREFESLIPQLPYIGGKQPFTEFLVFTAMLLAIYRVNRLRGRTLEETGELIFEIGR